MSMVLKIPLIKSHHSPINFIDDEFFWAVSKFNSKKNDHKFSCVFSSYFIFLC